MCVSARFSPQFRLGLLDFSFRHQFLLLLPLHAFSSRHWRRQEILEASKYPLQFSRKRIRKIKQIIFGNVSRKTSSERNMQIILRNLCLNDMLCFTCQTNNIDASGGYVALGILGNYITRKDALYDAAPLIYGAASISESLTCVHYFITRAQWRNSSGKG